MRILRALIRARSGSAAAEMGLVLPFMLALILGSVELGSYFLAQHALTKQVRDGARYGSRINLEDNYSCEPAGVDPAAETEIRNVTRTGSVDGTAPLKRPFTADDAACTGAPAAVAVSVRCADADDYSGIWAGLESDIPVVKVTGAVRYRPVLADLGFSTAGLCVRAESEIPVAGR